MKIFYALLFAFSIVIIDPWGNSRGGIWTEPKVLCVVLIALLNFSILWEKRKSLTIPRPWQFYSLLWGVFLLIGLFSTWLSPFPLRSLFGQEQMGDGWLYWCIIGAFTLSNTLLLTHYPELIFPQLQGLLWGGGILALSVFPQVINWQIDYTATMGQLIQKNVLVSTIFAGQQPIGLYSHRGHTAFVLAAVLALFLFAWQQQWLKERFLKIAAVPIFLALLFTQTREGILAFLVAAAYLLGRKYRKILIPMILAGLCVIAIATASRKLENLPVVKQITSDRVHLWQLAKRGIIQRPILGWGFDGFGTAYASTLNPNIKVVRLGDFNLDYLNKQGKLRTLPLPTAKAHNLILDVTLSVGILGMISYFALVLFGWQQVGRLYPGIEVVGICYLVFTLTWFECAQFSHLFWWSLSLWGTKDQKLSGYPIDSSPAESFSADTPFSWLSKISNAVLLVSLIGLFTAGFLYKNPQYSHFAILATKKSVCGSPSGGAQDNPIANKYGSDAYTWTNQIKWNCTYNIKDFQGNTALEQYNAARDAAVANGGGVVYFPAGIYQFADHLYLKDGVVIRGETPSTDNAKSINYQPPTQFVFPEYEPQLSGNGTSNNTGFKKILTTLPNSDSNIGIVNVDINRAGIYLLGNIDIVKSQNILIYGIRSNNVADPIPNIPVRSYQSAWLRYSDPFAANIKINAYANILVSNNRLNDAITDNYEQPGYQIQDVDDRTIITYTEGGKVPFDYGNHYGIVVNRVKVEGNELDFALAADSDTEPGLFRRGIAIRDNWIYHTMRAAIRAAGEGLLIQDNEIKDKVDKQWWTNPWGTGLPEKNVTYENRAIDWAGWNVLIEGNRYEVYRHRLLDSKELSVDGEGILIQECCGGTQVKGVEIIANEGNAYIGLYKVPVIENVRIARNKLFSAEPKTILFWIVADTNKESHAMDNVLIEDNITNGSMIVKASNGGRVNKVKNNLGVSGGSIRYSCHVQVEGNQGLKIKPCWQDK